MKSTNNQRIWTLVSLLALAMSAATLGAAQGQPGSLARSNPIDCEPLVVFDVSGYGIAGMIHQHFVVYSDGLASLSALSPGGSYADLTWVTTDRAKEFNNELLSAGALELNDRLTPGTADIPLTTVTVFNGGDPSAVHNTFSFYAIGGDDDYQAVVEIVQAFIGFAFYAE